MTKMPLKGLKVLEFTHAVMGPSCGLLLADLGAEVIYCEPPGGSPTRKLKGFGSGYFSYFSRNKKSLCVDLKTKEGIALIHELVQHCDILCENFAPGTMERLGLSYEQLREGSPQLIYCSMKGFLKGPYENRTAMDEVVQMLGGLAYMTGPPGKPLRAGTSIIDITGGMFAVIGVLAALREREKSGHGSFVKSSLFETTAFAMGQHMAWSAICKKPIPPMPARVSAWSVYQIFKTLDQDVFIGIISEKHWQSFCLEFACPELLDIARFKDNNSRISAREELLPILEKLLKTMSSQEVIEACEKAKIPFAPVGRPEDLATDIHLNASHGLVQTKFPTGEEAMLPALPLEWDGERFPLRRNPPQIGEHSNEILRTWLNRSEEELALLEDKKVIQNYRQQAGETDASI